MKEVTKKEGKKRNSTIYVQLSTDKKLATTQDRQTLQNSDEKQLPVLDPTLGCFY